MQATPKHLLMSLVGQCVKPITKLYARRPDGCDKTSLSTRDRFFMLRDVLMSGVEGFDLKDPKRIIKLQNTKTGQLISLHGDPLNFAIVPVQNSRRFWQNIRNIFPQLWRKVTPRKKIVLSKVQ